MDEFITKKTSKYNLELVVDCVIDYIQDTLDLNSVSLVSKKFFDINSKTRKHVTVHVPYLPNPKRLNIRFPNLESLTLKSYSYRFYTAHKCSIPVTPWIREIVEDKFECLKLLCIRNMVVSPSDLQLLAATRGGSLRSLEISRCKLSSKDGLIDIAKCCIELRNLRLKDNPIDGLPNGKWLHELALCNTVMESLSFDEPSDTYDMKDVRLLAKKCSKSLVSLNICQRSLIDLEKVFKHAKKLDHFGCGIIDEDWDYSRFKFPPNICGLNFFDLGKASFPFLLPYLNQLRELDLSHYNLQPVCHCFLFERCPSLEVLVTDDICEDEGLQVIGQFCKKMRKLTYNGFVTHVGLTTLAKGCTNLDYLKVHLLDVSNQALECVGTHLNNVQDLRIWLGSQEGITDLPLDNGVRAMLMACKKLERLDIGFCVGWSIDQDCAGALTDVGLGYIGKYGHNLRHLTLTYAGESDKGLLELSKGCPKIRKLKLDGCPFSDQAIATSVFNINHSLRYIRVNSYSRNVLVLTRPMVSVEMGESRRERVSEAERSKV